MVSLELGHRATVRKQRTGGELFTHDWEIYVQGVNGAHVEAFIEKVVFTLHKSFTKPRRGKFVCVCVRQRKGERLLLACVYDGERERLTYLDILSYQFFFTFTVLYFIINPHHYPYSLLYKSDI